MFAVGMFFIILSIPFIWCGPVWFVLFGIGWLLTGRDNVSPVRERQSAPVWRLDCDGKHMLKWCGLLLLPYAPLVLFMVTGLWPSEAVLCWYLGLGAAYMCGLLVGWPLYKLITWEGVVK